MTSISSAYACCDAMEITLDFSRYSDEELYRAANRLEAALDESDQDSYERVRAALILVMEELTCRATPF